MEYRLLEKTEIWISPVHLSSVDLTECSRSAAKALGLHPDEIMVTDALNGQLVLDVLVPTIPAEKIVARKKELLEAISKVKGIQISQETEVHSDGILGLISLEAGMASEVLDRSQTMEEEITERFRKRAMIFPTGHEILEGQIRDTNTPFLLEVLRKEGYMAVKGRPLQDDMLAIERGLAWGLGEGYGLLITTGGIGAERKDCTLEALHRLDPHAITPYILKFSKGEGRHDKEGVRIGVGTPGKGLVVCLPGPHDEVQIGWSVLRRGLKQRWSKEELAGTLARALRRKFLKRSRPDQLYSGIHSREAVNGTHRDRNVGKGSSASQCLERVESD